MQNPINHINKPFKRNLLQQVMKSPMYDKLQDLMGTSHLYTAAIKEINTKLEILDSEFKVKYDHNPIHHIESRLKKPESVLRKAIDRDIPLTSQDIINQMYDIAGIRVICSFTSDIYRIAEMISSQNDIRVISVKDYIVNPKQSGYKSYHMLVTVPIYLSDCMKTAKVEIQIRTVAMDFWASLEHKIHYKFEGNAPERIKEQLVECSRIVSELDERMRSLNEEIQQLGYPEEDWWS